MKAGLMAPLYLSVSWVLTVSYQLFTDTAVRSIASYLSSWWPSAGAWLNANISTLVFVYAFTWIFVLSSVIPSVILGKERGVLIHYIVVLTLSMIAFFMPDMLQALGVIRIDQIFESASILQNPLLAFLYLAIPYLFMLGLDIRSRWLKVRPEMPSDEGLTELKSQTPKYTLAENIESNFLKGEKEDENENW
jgi:hypothetical protein